MSAPPIIVQDNSDIKLSKIFCFEHPNNQIVGVCVDKNCKNINKYMCLDCMFEIHSGHFGLKTNKIEEIYKEKLNKCLKENELVKNELKKFERNIRDKINNIKNKLNDVLENFYKNFMEEVKKNNPVNYCDEITLIKNNYPPNNKEQLNILIEQLLKLYNKSKNNNKEEIKPSSRNFEHYDLILRDKLNSIENYFNLFMNPESIEKFEWSTKTYRKYGFYYNLEENNTKVTKNIYGGTMTICQGLNPLEIKNKYKLEYFINYINGDFDIGFGDEKVGPQCWLRVQNGYCISSSGIFIDGNNVSTNIKLQDAKKIIFIVDLNNYNSEVYMDDKKVFTFQIRPGLIYYPMIAIRELNNSVKLKLSKLKL